MPFRALASEGLVTIELNRGATVKDFSDDEVRKIGEIRLAQDILSAHLASYFAAWRILPGWSIWPICVKLPLPKATSTCGFRLTLISTLPLPRFPEMNIYFASKTAFISFPI